MSDDEIIGIRCSGCGCAITPELHEAVSGEYEMQFFVCPFCGKRYVVTVTDAELREGIAEYRRLLDSIEKDGLSDEERQAMVALKEANRQRSLALKEALGYGND